MMNWFFSAFDIFLRYFLLVLIVIDLYFTYLRLYKIRKLMKDDFTVMPPHPEKSKVLWLFPFFVALAVITLLISIYIGRLYYGIYPASVFLLLAAEIYIQVKYRLGSVFNYNTSALIFYNKENVVVFMPQGFLKKTYYLKWSDIEKISWRKSSLYLWILLYIKQIRKPLKFFANLWLAETLENLHKEYTSA